MPDPRLQHACHVVTSLLAPGIHRDDEAEAADLLITAPTIGARHRVLRHLERRAKRCPLCLQPSWRPAGDCPHALHQCVCPDRPPPLPVPDVGFMA